MYLKKLELVGFKSFAQKTVLDFPAGVTAIVGPNGSGKSNVIDAIRWLLGEREAKNVRGLKAEDLIFAGNPKRARLGLAQVALTFDNHNHFFPVDYAEVSVRRRVSRDGLSEYYLNDVQVRLKDVIDFFAKARLGTKGFTIINQGDSDLFVRAAPEERREMLEEILGLRQYQLKKHDAENKLKNTRINLDKVKALIDEIAPHLRLLRRQTVRWEKHDELAAELKTLEDQYFASRIAALTKDEGGAEPKIKELEKHAAEKQKEVKALEAELRAVEKSSPKEDTGFAVIAKRRGEFLEQKAKIQKELGRLEAQLEFIAEQAESHADPEKLVTFLEDTRAGVEGLLEREDMEEIRNFLEGLMNDIDEMLAGKGDEKDERLTAVEAAKKNIAARMEEIDEELSELAESEKELGGKFENFNEQFKKAYARLETKKGEIAALESERNKLLLERERFSVRREELERRLRESGRRAEEFAGIAPDPAFDAETAERRIFKLRAELSGIGEIDQAVVKEAKETEERHVFLKNQLADLEKAYADLKELIKELDQKIHAEFTEALRKINEEFHRYFQMMFGGGRAKLHLEKPKKAEILPDNGEGETPSAAPIGGEDIDAEHAFDHGGLEIDIAIPRKRITGLDMLSGGEKSLVSIAALFALIAVSPPPFLVLDEIDAALDESNTRRFAELVKDFSKKTQFVIVTHNRATMEAADILYGVTMEEDGVSKVLSLKLE